MTKKAADEIVPDDDKSLRDTLSETIEAEEAESAASGGDDESTATPEESVKAEVGKKSEKAEESEEEDGKLDAADKSKPADSTDTDASVADDSAKVVEKAPVDWPPKAREHWSKLPKEVRTQIAQREKDVALALQDTAAAKTVYKQFTDLASSYAPIMAAEGVSDPMQAVHGLFKTVAELRMGSPAQKAQRMAKLIDNYGIDIGALDNALAGQPIQSPEESQLTQLLDQRMAPVNQLLQELQARQQNAQQQTQKEAEAAVQSFQGEFLKDVRMEMADFIDMAAKRGQNMSLQDAYDKAVLLNPEIQGILKERQERESLLGKQTNIQNKENASSSLNGRQLGTPSVDQNASIRDSLEAAWGEDGRI